MDLNELNNGKVSSATSELSKQPPGKLDTLLNDSMEKIGSIGSGLLDKGLGIGVALGGGKMLVNMFDESKEDGMEL